MTGKWRKLRDIYLSDLYSSPNVIRVIKSRRMRWAGHVARMGERRGAYRVLVRKSERKRPPLRMVSTNISLKLNLFLRYLMSQLFYG